MYSEAGWSGGRVSFRWNILKFSTPAAYEEILHSLQPVYGLTAGLSNKTVVKLLHQLLKQQSLKSEYLPEEIKEKYQLSDINYALRTIHFPKNMDELLVSRKRLVFDEFLFLFFLFSF